MFYILYSEGRRFIKYMIHLNEDSTRIYPAYRWKKRTKSIKYIYIIVL